MENFMSTLTNIAGGFGSLMTALTNAGVTPSNALAAVKSLAGNTQLKNTLTALVNQMVVNEGNAANLTKLASDVGTTPGCPAAIVALANSAATLGLPPTEFMQNIEMIETEIAKL
jgi:hypothetical protein